MAAINVTSGDNDTHTIKQGARAVVRLSNGIPYVIVENITDEQIQVWKGNATTPASFSEPDVGNGPTGTVWGSCSVCVDVNDVIHISYCTDEGKASQLRYVQFASDVFLNDAQVIADLEEDPTAITNLQTAIAIDSNNKPHIAFCHYAKTGGNTNYEISYINNVDANWNAGVYYEVEGTGNAKNCKYSDISIDKDNKPVISYSNETDYDVGTAIGNQNDAESFTLQDIDTDLNFSDPSTSICVDSSGNHYVAYRRQADNLVYIRKHTYGVGWGTWVASTTGSDQGQHPSIVAEGTDIYVFYEGIASNDIVYEKVTGGSSWQGDVTLETGIYRIVKAKWAYAVDRDSGGTNRGGGSGRLEIDYAFTDETPTVDILFNSLTLEAGVNISAGVDVLTLTEYATGVNAEVSFTAGIDALAITEYTADVNIDVSIAAGIDTLVLTEYAAVVDVDEAIEVIADIDTLTLTEYATTVNAEISILAGTDALVLTENAATIKVDNNIQADIDALVITENVANINAEISISAGIDALVLTENAADVNLNVNVSTGVDALVLTEYAANINAEVNILAEVDTLSLTEYQAVVDVDEAIEVIANIDVLSLTEYAANINAEVSFTAGVDTLSLTEYAAAVNAEVNISAEADALVITEAAATIKVDNSIQAGADTLVLTGYPATVNAEISILAGVDTLVLTEYAATINAEVSILAGIDILTLAEYQAVVNAETNISASVDTLTLSSFAADINIDINIQAMLETLVIAEYSANVEIEAGSMKFISEQLGLNQIQGLF